MAVDQQLEIERKYDVAADTRVPDLTGTAGVTSVADPVEHRLVATYFDTAGLRLLRAGISLRRRAGGHDEGWHLKLPDEGGGRHELHVPLTAGSEDEVPAELRDLVLGRVRREPLAPVARLRTNRTVHVLLGGGTPLAELCDDRVSAETMAGDPAVDAWREWELELLAGPAKLLDQSEPLILAAGATLAAGPSKVRRALGDRLLTSGTPGPGREGSTRELLCHHLAHHVERLQREDLLLRAGEHEGVHQMRIAARRLRSALATYRRVFAPGTTDGLREELRWLGRLLAGARDAQVLRERLVELAATQPPEVILGPVVRRIEAELDAAFRRDRERALEELRGERYLRLLDTLDAFAADPPFAARADKPAGKVLPSLLERDLRRMRKRHKAWRRSEPGQRDHALHEVRKAAKRLRYAAETAEPVLGRRARRWAAAAQGVQQLLGEHQDTVVARTVLREIGVRAHLDGENGFSFGRLHALEEARAADLVRRLPKRWSAVPSGKL
ncbi:MAG TPA: CYTH and CHAD domain-containing protein [Marmoricola sp.]|nr:CYTH and CHAD domain-containing protein [Marmoricola sp.]